MEAKDWVALGGIFITLIVGVFNLIYSIINSRKTTYINTVTTSRMKWIDSLRDKVAAFIAVTIRILNPEAAAREPNTVGEYVRQWDTLAHQIVLHLNPDDREDKEIVKFVKQVQTLTLRGVYTEQLQSLVDQLRDATGVYIKKEWEKVKTEAKSGETATKK